MRERFSVELRVRFSETDLQGHVFFGNYLDYFDVALVEYQRMLGYPYQRMVAEGVDMVYVEAVSRYHGSARFDDLLRVHCHVGHLGNSSVRFEFEAVRADDGGRIASGSITGVCLDHRTRRPTPVPEAFRRAVLEYQGEVSSAMEQASGRASAPAPEK